MASKKQKADELIKFKELASGGIKATRLTEFFAGDLKGTTDGPIKELLAHLKINNLLVPDMSLKVKAAKVSEPVEKYAKEPFAGPPPPTPSEAVQHT